MTDQNVSDPVAIVDAQIEAYVAGDAARFAGWYAEDARCVRLPSGDVVAEGRAEIERVWGALFAARKVRFELMSRIASGPFVVDHERITRERDGYTFDAIASYEVIDGLIRRVWLFEPVTPIHPGDT